MVTLFAVLAIILYSVSAYLQYSAIHHPNPNTRKQVLSLGSLAVIVHGFSWFIPVFTEPYHFGFFQMASLIALVISTLIVVSALRKPLEALFLGVFPMSAIIMLGNLLIGHEPAALEDSYDNGLLSHILLSIMAYSVLSIASVQALLLIVQDRQLKHKHMSGIIRVLPPLQTMDRLLFEMIGIGTFLLSLAIVSGFVFLDDLFAQHLAHKTVFTLLAWLVYTALLLGHWRFGWRGNVASKWTLVGTVLLVLAYFGSKLVLEIILKG